MLPETRTDASILEPVQAEALVGGVDGIDVHPKPISTMSRPRWVLRMG
jgi:hypothetical protein